MKLPFIFESPETNNLFSGKFFSSIIFHLFKYSRWLLCCLITGLYKMALLMNIDQLAFLLLQCNFQIFYTLQLFLRIVLEKSLIRLIVEAIFRDLYHTLFSLCGFPSILSPCFWYLSFLSIITHYVQTHSFTLKLYLEENLVYDFLKPESRCYSFSLLNMPSHFINIC